MIIIVCTLIRRLREYSYLLSDLKKCLPSAFGLSPKSTNPSIEDLTDELVNTVSLQLQSDVPVSLALSSGIDSNTMQALLGC